MAKIWINIYVQFFATREAVKLFSNILLCWADQYGRLDTLNIKICPLLMQWAIVVGSQEMLQKTDKE